jgi:hypothetical protein
VSLADRLAATQTAAAVPREHRAPTGWEPGVRYDPATGFPTEVTTEQLERDVQGAPSEWADLIAHLLPMVPAGHEVRLVEARYDPVAWVRSTETREVDGLERRTPATTRPAWRYRFRIVPAAAVASDRDVAELVRVARANRPVTQPAPRHRPHPRRRGLGRADRQG